MYSTPCRSFHPHPLIFFFFFFLGGENLKMLKLSCAVFVMSAITMAQAVAHDTADLYCSSKSVIDDSGAYCEIKLLAIEWDGLNGNGGDIIKKGQVKRKKSRSTWNNFEKISEIHNLNFVLGDEYYPSFLMKAVNWCASETDTKCLDTKQAVLPKSSFCKASGFLFQFYFQ